MKILHRYTSQLLFEIDGDTKATVEAAVAARANLAGANLEGANLAGANLAGANLAGACPIAPDTRIETGETWKQYLEEVVPALIAAGGHPVSEKGWACHAWDNCPMAEAFNIHASTDAPLLLRPRVEQFVRYFDAGMIPMPECVVRHT